MKCDRCGANAFVYPVDGNEGDPEWCHSCLEATGKWGLADDNEEEESSSSSSFSSLSSDSTSTTEDSSSGSTGSYLPPVKPTKPLKRAPKQIPIAELNQKRKFHFDED